MTNPVLMHASLARLVLARLDWVKLEKALAMMIRATLRFLTLLCGFALFSVASVAQESGLDRADPALVQAAKSGDVQAAYELGFALADPWLEPQLREALPWFQQAYRDSKTLGDDQIMLAGDTALMLSRVLAALSEVQGALDLAAEAERRFHIFAEREPGDLAQYKLAVTLEDQGILLTDLSRYAESIVYFQRGRAIYLMLKSDVSVANSWLNQGIAHERMGDYQDAIEAYKKSLDLFVEINGEQSREVGYLANNIGWVLVQVQSYADARKLLEMAAGIIAPIEGNFSAAMGSIRINLGIVSKREGKFDEAIEWGMKAMPFLASNRKLTLDDQRWNFEMLSQAFAAKGNIDRAIFFGKMAVNTQQEFRASNTVSGANDVEESQREWGRLYKDLADLLIGQGRISEAQAVLNMAKEEEVFNFLRRDSSAKLTETRAVLTSTELDDEAKLSYLAQAPVAAEKALQELEVKLTAGTATADEENQLFLLQDALQKATDEFDAAVTDFLAAAPIDQQVGMKEQFDAVGSYQSVLADLPRNTAILQVAALEDATHLFLTLPGVTLHAEVKIPRADLSRLVFDALDAVQNVAPDADEKLAALYQVVFAPVDQALRDAGSEVVMLNLDGFLRYVPFAALNDGQGYLVERYAFTLYSTAVPTQFDRAAREPAQTAGFGVTLAHPGFSALPGVAAELQTIFTPGVLSGETELDAQFDERSLKRVLLKKPKILHIASHFSLLPGREDDSFLLLGDGTHLPLSKIRSTRALRFQGVDLLTLSACQTARGGDGAEIDGFGATAQLNGAGAVLASLWPVSDAATPELMHDFYEGMMVQGLDKAESLRQAQLKMLHGEGTGVGGERSAVALETAATPVKKGFSHPYFWSAFVLMGNWL